MKHYERLGLSRIGNTEVALCLFGEPHVKGKLEVCLTNEDYEDDGEEPCLALSIEGELIEYELKDIDFIVRLSDVYVNQAV